MPVLLARALSDQLGHSLVVQSVTRPDEADSARSIRFLVFPDTFVKTRAAIWFFFEVLVWV